MQIQRKIRVIFSMAVLALTACALTTPKHAIPEKRMVIQVPAEGLAIDKETMQRVYDEIKTPYKYGIVLKTGNETKLDCPTVFRKNGKWYMTYIIFEGKGYETFLAESDDLLHWEQKGRILSMNENDGWDKYQKAGYAALVDHEWGGSMEIEKHDGKYWMSYFGGELTGYETDPLSMGMAHTDSPTKAEEWERLPEPILTGKQEDARYWEKLTLYKSTVIHDKSRTLGFPFVMFYNAKPNRGYERIGMAVSDDMRYWFRYGNEPVVDNGSGISGDPQIVRMGDLWVMFYFGAFFRPGAFDSFAVSENLVHWTKWDGPDLIEPSEPWDKTFAHKPWMIKWEGVVYHFYCAVGDEGRVIALATSKPMK